MDNFERSIDFTLKWEGGKNFNVVDGKPVIKGAAQNDPGGATAYGITWNTLKTAYNLKIISHNDICKLTVEEAKIIYKKNYWEKFHFEQINWPACMCCFDCSVNHGGFAIILQNAVTDCGQKLKRDGLYGPQTLNALINCEPFKLSNAIYIRRKDYYDKIINRNPKLGIYRKGWYKRAEDMAKVAGLL